MSDFDNQGHYSYRPPYEPEEGEGSPGEQRQTRPLSPDEQHPLPEEGPQQVNPDWRSRRKSTGRRSARRGARRSPSASPQEMQIWLQQGGWMYVAGVAFVFVVALVIMLSLNSSRGTTATSPTPPVATGSTSTSSESGSAPGGSENNTLEPLPTVTPLPTPAATPTSAQPQVFVVSGTGSYGLFLRADHATDATILETLQDGTRVEQVGEDFAGADYVWRKVRTPSGQEGWVAVDWLQKATP